jgi:ribosomal protein L16 Arg81 hydroxylase
MIDLNITSEEFTSGPYERSPVLFRNACRDHHIGWDEVNHAIYVGEKEADFIRIHKDGFVDPDSYSEYCNDVGTVRRRINRPALRSLLEQGGVLIYNRIDMFSHAISRICEHFAKLTRASATANGYVAFRDKESFGKHWDTHDVFAVQLLGRKRWLVYAPTFVLPTAGQTSLHHKQACPAEPAMDIVLEAGDVLYLPRGWWHTAIPLNEETFHVAVGIHAPTVVDYLRWVVDKLAPSEEVLRRSIHSAASGDAQMLDAARAFSELASSSASLQRFHEESRRNERTASILDLSQGLGVEPANVRDGLISLNSKRGRGDIGSEMTINGSLLKLGERQVRVLRELADQIAPVTFDRLSAMVADIPHDILEQFLRGFLIYDVISVHKQAHRPHSKAEDAHA